MIAIDFGTTNSSVAVMEPSDQVPRVVSLEYGDEDSYDPSVLPSAVCDCKNVECQNAPEMFGHPALRHYFETGHDTMLLQEMKLSFDQSTISEPSMVEVREDWVLRDEGGFLTPEKKKRYQAVYAADVPLTRAQFVPGTAKIVKHLARTANFRDHTRKLVAVGVPATFGDSGRRMVREAVKLGAFGPDAGYDNVVMYSEPLAAARAYLQITKPGNLLVLDYGGGTLDICVSHVDEHMNINMSTISQGGFPEGGAKMDKALVLRCLEKAGGQSAQKYESLKPVAKQRISRNVEKAKIELSRTDSVQVRLPGLDTEELLLDRADIAFALSPIMTRMVARTMEVIYKNGRTMSDITYVVLSGGSALSPVVQQTVVALFKHVPEDRFVLPNPSNPADVETCLCAVTKGLALLHRDGVPPISLPLPNKLQS
ncbi:MAG: molecular chaperone DnaK [Acidobacteriales bacterium]|nr:molecular chaperone DnaK [Terriglobales bacterium]